MTFRGQPENAMLLCTYRGKGDSAVFCNRPLLFSLTPVSRNKFCSIPPLFNYSILKIILIDVSVVYYNHLHIRMKLINSLENELINHADLLTIYILFVCFRGKVHL